MVHDPKTPTVPETLVPGLTAYVASLAREGRVNATFERGPATINIKHVAQRAGVAVGSLYQYFPDRAGLLDFAVELCVRSVVDALAQARPYLFALPLREALRVYLFTGMEWGATERAMFRFLGRAAYEGDPALADRAVRPIATAMRELTRDILDAAAARGEIRGDIDFEAVARIVNGITLPVIDAQLLPHLNVYFQLTDDSMPAERVLEALVDFIVTAVSPPEER
jgi:AcrR family transcriptional regulator